MTQKIKIKKKNDRCLKGDTRKLVLILFSIHKKHEWIKLEGRKC